MKKKSNCLTLSDSAVSAACSTEDFARLKALSDAWKARINLSRKHNAYMQNDFWLAVEYYLKNGVGIEEIETRLSPEKIGYFYFEEPEDWYTLDTAAMIYPLSMSRNWMPFFRLSAYLKGDVVPEILQMALSIVICRFPYYAVALRRGVFWHYMDGCRRRYAVEEESRRPFTVLNLTKYNAPCFRVQYYKNRISVEFFHLLTDGTGGTVFLKTLLGEYLRLLGAHIPCECGLIDLSDTPSEREWSDDFHLADPIKPSHFSGKRARQMRGSISSMLPHQILHFELNAEELRRAAHEKNATVTAFLLTHFFFACKKASNPAKSKIQIQIPCNMRKYYPSITQRNFAMYCILGLSDKEIDDFDRVLAHLSTLLKEETSKEALTKQMVAGTKLVHSLRFVPLFLKAPLVRRFYPYFSDLILTTTLSNLGVVELPEAMNDFVDKLDFVLGTTVQNRATCSVITYQEKAVLSIFKATAHPGFEEALYAQLKKAGLTLTVTGSQANGFHRCISED